MSLNDEEREIFSNRERFIYAMNTKTELKLKETEEKGMQKGMEKSLEKWKLEVARKMLLHGIKPEEVIEVIELTGLSEADINQLAQ